MKYTIGKIASVIFLTALLMATEVYSQGFANLNFEDASITFVDPMFPNYIYANTGIPSWTGYYSTSTATNQTGGIWYDNVSGGGAFIALTDTNSNELSPLQGAYSLLLEGSGASTPTAASIGQTAQIPTNALSLSFFLSLNSTLR